MRSQPSFAPVIAIGFTSLVLLHCGPTAEPNVPGPTPPPAETAAPTAMPTATPTASASAASTAAPAETAAAEAHHAGPPHWTYEGAEGPAKWGDLSPEYAACKTGTSQSPIDIVTRQATVDKALHLVDFVYGAPIPLQIFNNGHTVQVQNVGAAEIKAEGIEWKLVQVHFHSPSEHAIDGKLLDLEAHFVHASDKGDLAVVGLLFKKGKENKAFAPIFDHIPTDVTKDPLPVPGTKIDLAKLLPPKPSYFTYSGSLTTPKCSEGVRWFVLKPTEEISEAQLQKFHGAVHGDNNRPVQPLGSRHVARLN